MAWNVALDLSGQLKRTPRPAAFHRAGGFLFGEDTPLKTDQLGAAGWDLRRGTWLPAAQGTLYSAKRQGFLPGRTGLNPLDGIPLATRGTGDRAEALLPPAGRRDYKGV